jgi:O-antigen/teichoic acid export membrane protein
MGRQGERLAKEEIRLQYSGYILFAARIVSIFTGLAFQLMIARSISTNEYGIWFNINDILAYFTLMAGVLPFWAMRFVARHEEGSTKTGIVANLLISLIATVVYIPLVPFITSSLAISQKYVILYYLVALEIIEYYALGIAEGCLRSITPQVLGYGLLTAEFSKITVGYVLIIQLHRPLEGGIIAMMLGFAVQSIYYSKLLAKYMREKIRWDYVKEWLKGSLLNVYNIIGNQIASYISIMLFAVGGDTARSNLGAAALIANIIGYSSYLTIALYPKLLADRKREDITTSIKTMLMFTMPMTVGAIALAGPYLAILNPVYSVAAPVLIVLSLDGLVSTVTSFLSSVLYGAERVDEKARMSFNELVKSRLFLAFSFPYFQSMVTLPIAYYVLTVYARNQALNAALYVSIINSLGHLALFLVLYVVVRGMIPIDIPWKNIAKYAFTSVLMGVILFVLPHPTRVYLTIAETAVGAAVYIGLLSAIDRETRALIHSVWQEIKIRIGGVA